MTLRRGFAVLLLIFISVGIYYPAIFAGANSVDDIHIITAYLNIDNFDLKSLFLPGSSGYYYRPILGLTFIFDKFVWGLNESFMHLENILFHGLNVVIVFLISEHVARRYSIEERLVPFCAALLFAVHPINSESVSWIAGRTDLIAGIFISLSILFLLIAMQRENVFIGLIAAVVFLISCLTKEVAVCALPGLLAIVAFHDSQDSLLHGLMKRWFFAATLSFSAITYFLFRFFAFRHGDSGINIVTNSVNAPTFDLLNNIRVILKVSGFYFKKIFIPWPLNFAIVRISDYYVIAGVILIITLVYMLYKRGLIHAFFLTSICVTAPALLVALARMAWTPVAERYLYIPCITFSVAISILVYKNMNQCSTRIKNLLYLLIVVFFIICSYSTVRRVMIWQSNIALFEDTLKNSPDFYLAKNELVYALQQIGRNDEAKKLMLSIEAPENSKRGGKLVDGNRAAIIAADGDLNGAKKLLLRNIEDSGSMYPSIAERIISINMKLISGERNSIKIKELRNEILTLLLKLQEQSGDPFYYYRIGQFHLSIGDRTTAQRSFSEAYLKSPEGAYYKPAAKKLAEKLK
ncbi:MAG: hypothetical protein HXX17_06955 [Geobacteraceae bacterium]|nr:hypothetical protein [Geobacteraceae bacterium]